MTKRPGSAATQPLTCLVADRAVSHPDRVFVQDVADGTATYAEAHDRALRWAGALRELGVASGARVATLLPNSTESVLTWLGIAHLRAWEAPIHPAFTGYMLEHAINTVQARVVIVAASLLPHLVESAAKLSCVQTVIVVGAADPVGGPFDVLASEPLVRTTSPAEDLEPAQAWDTAAVIYTSGTTGPSKGVVVPWSQLRATAQRTFPYEDLGNDEAIYVFTPSSHVGAKALPYLAGLLGGRAVLRPDFKIDRFLSDVKDFGITTAPLVGAIPHFLNSIPEQPDDANISLHNVVMAPLAPNLERFQRRFGVRVCSAYNMTELSIPFTSDGWDVTNWTSVGRLHKGWPGYEVRLVDNNDAEVPTGEVGELIVRTAEPWTLNAGYCGMAEATAEAWRNGWFHTGDGFTKDADGNYYFVDRMKDSIRRRGENISSFELETIVNSHPAVAESAAIAVPAEINEDEIKLLVVVKAQHTVLAEELMEFLVPRMPRFMTPRYIEFVDDLPKTPGTMRTMKQQLRQRGLNERTWDRYATASDPSKGTASELSRP